MDNSLNIAAGTITNAITVDVLDPIEVVATLDAELQYDARDPFAVTATFATAAGAVSWTFARELLAAGLAQPVGDGDIHIWPSIDIDGHPVTLMELQSPDGNALIQFEDAALVAFFDRTVALVPLGTESMELMIDNAIAAILAVEGA